MSTEQVEHTEPLKSEAESSPKLKLEFVTNDATPEEIQFQNWINSGNKVGFDTRTRELIAFNPDTNSTDEPQQRVGMDRLNILMGKDLKGEPLIDLAVAGADVEIFCPENEKEKWRSLLERRKKERVAARPKKTLNLTKALDGTVRSLMNPEPIDQNRRVIKPEDLTRIIFSKQTGSDILAAGSKLAEKSGFVADFVLDNATKLIELIPEGKLGDIIKNLSPIPGYKIYDAITIVEALNNLNKLRSTGELTETNTDPAVEIAKILGAVIPYLDSNTVKGLASGILPAKK